MPSILEELLLEFPDKKWYWRRFHVTQILALNLLKIIQNYLGIGLISDNPNITFEFVEKHKNKPWNKPNLSKNESFTPK